MADQGFDAFLIDFVLEAQERTERLEELLLEALDREGAERDALLDDARRELHTLKGNAGMMGLRELQSAAHRLEDLVGSIDPDDPSYGIVLSDLDAFRTMLLESGNASATPDQGAAARSGTRTPLRSVRVQFDALDELVDLLAEMVVFRNRVDDALTHVQPAAGSADTWQTVIESHEALGKTLGLIQDRIMAVRMVPLRSLFGQLRRIVHDESVTSSREARLIASGGDTPMDKALLECASEALGHLVRNAVTHGVESSEARSAAGKARQGSIHLTATTHSDEVVIDVRDDGAGIDGTALLATASARGIDVHKLRDPLDLIFRSGFSTRSGSDVSAGRGMGLSAAREAVHRLGGTMEVASEPGKGTRFRLRLPLSVSITRALIVRANGEDYAMPLAAVAESVRFRPEEAHIVAHAGVINWRGRVLPLLDLGSAMGSARHVRDSGYVVILEVEGRQRGILVDDLTGMREIVVKKLGDIGAPPPGIAGATILGDGRVLLILDPKSLMAISPMLDPDVNRGVAA